MKPRTETRRTACARETEELGALLGARLAAGDAVLLEGDLGAGKTTFVRGLARGLGVDARAVSSPTYVIVQEYAPEDARSGPTLVHVDAYRLDHADDESLGLLGWDRIAADARVLAVEWPGKLPDTAIAGRRWRVTLQHAGGDAREVTIEPPGDAGSPPALGEVLGPAAEGRAIETRGSTVPCRTCGRGVARDEPTAPFCSERCRSADLGRWFDGAYRISRDIKDSDLDTVD